MTTHGMQMRVAMATKQDCLSPGGGGGIKHAQGRPRLRFHEGGGIKAPPKKRPSRRSSPTKVIVPDLGVMFIGALTCYSSRLENQL
jgi:hypothetical protein